MKDAAGVLTSAGGNIIDDGCPIVSVSTVAATCANANGSITAAGSDGTAPYQFSIDGVNFQANNVFTGLIPANYTITVKDANGFTNTVTTTVGNICPVVVAVANSETCGNNNGSITASGSNGTPPYLYSLDGINFQSSPAFPNVAQGNYTVTIKDVNGLTNTINIIIGNIPGPQLTANVVAATCMNNDGSITALQNGGTWPFQYALNNGNFQGTGTFSNLDTGIKIITLQDANGCVATQTVTVPLANMLFIDAGPDITICEGQGSPMNANSNGLSFTWIPGSGLNNFSILNPVASPPYTTKYYITATQGICSETDSVTILVNPAPVGKAGTDTAICFGKSMQLNGTGGVNYTWSPATYLDNPDVSDPIVMNPVSTITYTLQVSDANNCKSLQDASLTITVTPQAKVFAGNDTSILINQPLQLNATDVNTSGFNQYTWTPSYGLNNSSIQNPLAVISQNTVYTVIASTPDHCESADTISIKVFSVSDIYVPSAFTPNGDGRNDILKAIPIGIKQFRYFAVFNRWGQRVFYTENPGVGWDGIINGRQQDIGTYVWMTAGMDFQGNAIERKGTVILIR